MALRSALAGTAATAAVLAAAGSPAAVDAAADAGGQEALRATLARFAAWDVAGQPGEGAVVLRLGLTLVLVALLAGLAGRARSRTAALLGAWGGVVVASSVAGAATYAYQVEVVLGGQTLDATYGEGLVRAVNAGSAFGAWAGWLAGVAVALVARGRAVRRPLARPAGPPWATTAGGGLTEAPPPPWWAPTRAVAEPGVRPGSSVFAPGSFPPVVPGLAAPRGPGAPDPEATQPVAVPPGAEPGPERPSHPGTAPGRDPGPSTRPASRPPDDPDATAPVDRPRPPGAPGNPSTDATLPVERPQGAGATGGPAPDATEAMREPADPTPPMARRRR